MSKLPKWANPPGLRSLIRRHGLYLGTNTKDGSSVFLDPARLRTHVDINGPPGVGKTRLLLAMFQQLCRIPRATVVFVNPKGDAGRQARDWSIANGYGKRLIWFDPGDTSDGYVMGWNPLKPNGLAVATHAKAAREAILSSWGQSNFDDTPQLARFLFLALHVVREQHLTLVEALRLLLPGSPLRQALLPMIADPYVQESLAYLDSLRDSRQDELLASSVAKLEAFVMDPVIRHVVTQQEHSIDFGEVIASHRIFIANIELYKPLRAGDVRTLGRLLVNDLLAHVFNQPEGKRTPVFFICDEVHVAAATDDLCIAIELGRELLFSCITAHQSPSQLKLEGSPRLYDAVRDCVRTKIVFGGLSAETLEGDGVLKDLVIDTYNPKAVKDELTSLEVEPVNRWHLQVAETESATVGTARSRGTSNTETEGHSHQWSYQDGVAESEGESESSGAAVGVQALAGLGETLLPSGEIVASSNHMTGGGESTFRGSARSRSRTESRVTGATEVNSTATSRGVNESKSEQRSTGRGVTRTWVQVTDLLKRRVVSSRTFYSPEEFLTMKLQEIKELPDGHFIVKTPHHPAMIVRAPYVRTPRISARQRVQGLARVYGQPCYGTPLQIRAEEGQRETRLLQAAAPEIASSRGPKRRRKSES